MLRIFLMFYDFLLTSKTNWNKIKLKNQNIIMIHLFDKKMKYNSLCVELLNKCHVTWVCVSSVYYSFRKMGKSEVCFISIKIANFLRKMVFVQICFTKKNVEWSSKNQTKLQKANKHVYCCMTRFFYTLECFKFQHPFHLFNPFNVNI